jgi:2-polyprenyl-6-methoxyphenol hydroxylase-like FAD-dependent oxidoreductase
MRIVTTTCCISGGGPAGIMLGYLLARSGVDVTILEKWPDFFRDFRGDTIHPSTMDILNELGLLQKFLALPHNETKQVALHISGEEIIVADFSHLKTACKFLGFIPQWDFLNFIAKEGKQYPNFHLLMETESTDLLWDKDAVVGVKAKDKEGEFEIRSALVVGADGRHSTIREKSKLAIEDLGAPIDVLWFELPRTEDGTATSLGYIDQGKMLVLIDRDTYWQCGYIIRKGDFDTIKANGIEMFRDDLLQLAPFLKAGIEKVTSWEQIKLLSVAVDHLDTWYLPGLICIGDSAHAMSPVGGVGINLAIQDAVAAANILVPAFHRTNGVRQSDLKAIQKRRARPARLIQNSQVFAHTRVIAHILSSKRRLQVPWQLKLIKRVPYLRRLPAYFMGVGFRPEHIQTSPAVSKQKIDR